LHLTTLNDERKWRLNMCGLLLQALIFFIVALTLRQTTAFLVSLLAILITDSVWLVLLRCLERESELLAFKQWMFSNLLLGLFLGVCLASRVWWLGASWEYRIAIATMIAALVAAVVDYVKNASLYSPSDKSSKAPAPPAEISSATSTVRPARDSSLLATVYVAAPLFTLAEREHNVELARALTLRFEGKMTFILPQILNTESQVDFKLIASTNIETLAGADIILACLDGVDADSGTSFEVGYARALGKPVLAYRSDLRQSEADGVNAMLRYGCTQYVRASALDTTFEHLADELAKQLSGMFNRDRKP
jgi:nucleoside 2-deoxyribosyltransferase